MQNMCLSCTGAHWVETGCTLHLPKLIVPEQSEEGENALHILLPPTPFSSLAPNKTMSHMVECVVPDELTVSIPPRTGLVLIVHACTHSVENQTPLLRDKGSEVHFVNNYIPITLGERAYRMDVIVKWETCGLGWRRRWCRPPWSLQGIVQLRAVAMGSPHLSCARYPLHRCSL